jgi:hypothetical protein
MKTLKFLLFAVLALSISMACSEDVVSGQEPDDSHEQEPDDSHEQGASNNMKENAIFIGKWKVIEEEDAWDRSIIRPVDYYTVWEFFSDGTIKHYYNIDNVDEAFKTYELKSDSLYIYHNNIKVKTSTHIYSYRFIDAEKNKIKMKIVGGPVTEMMQPLLWIYERVNE